MKILVFVLTVTLLSLTCTAAIKVSTVQELQAINSDANSLAADYIQICDINAADTKMWNKGEGFAPIGTDVYHPFTGTYNGNGYTISNLYINRSQQYQGLFGVTGLDSEILNVGLVDVNMTGSFYNGSLIGRRADTSTGTVVNCYSTGIIHSVLCGGGLIGRNIGSVTNCYSTVDVEGWAYLGGLIGRINGGIVSNSYATGNITGDSFIGGLAGEIFLRTGLIVNCYSTGNVSGTDHAIGGLVGQVNPTSDLGYPEEVIINCYSTGHVSGKTNTGGLAGYYYDENPWWLIIVTNSFWDTQTSGWQTSCFGTGKTTSQMKSINTFSNWNIVQERYYLDETWYIDDSNDYPRLGWPAYHIREPFPKK